MDSLSDEEFHRMFRMTRGAFSDLLSMIEPFMPVVDTTMATLSSGSSISNVTKLACTLRWLAGGSYIDICFAWGVSKSTFFAENGVIWPTMEAINECFEIGLPVNDDAELQSMADGYKRYSHGELPGCVMAIDGWVARTRK
eukprot:gene19230-21868_t